MGNRCSIWTSRFRADAEKSVNTDGLKEPPTMSPERRRPSEATPQLYRRRYAILGIFILLSASNAFQWIEYASIATIVRPYYDVPYMAIDWTSIVYMFNYVPLILPATWLLDRHGLRLIALLGSFGNALGACIKCVSARPDRFLIGFLGQIIVGSSQVFILNVPPRLAAVWFGPKEVSTACALGVFGNQLGIAAGFILPARIVPNSPNDTAAVTDGLQMLFFASAGINIIVFLLVLLFFGDSPPSPPSSAQLAAIEATFEKNYVSSLKQLLCNKNYLLLLVTYGINVGVFYAIGTLLNQIMGEYFPKQEEDIGTAGLLIVLAGMVGSVVCGVWLDKTHTYKMTTLLVYLLSCLGMGLFTVSLSFKAMWIAFICSSLLGFFMTGYLPIGFEFGAEITYPVAEGTMSGLLNASAQPLFRTIYDAKGLALYLCLPTSQFSATLRPIASLLGSFEASLRALQQYVNRKRNNNTAIAKNEKQKYANSPLAASDDPASHSSYWTAPFQERISATRRPITSRVGSFDASLFNHLRKHLSALP